MKLHHPASLAAATVVVSGLLVTLGQAPASAASDFWVDAGSAVCSDAGTGTSAVPFCTISAAAKKAVNAGDVVHVLPGTYREQVTVAGSGTAVSPISFLGSAGAVVVGTQSLSDTAGWTATGTNAWSRPYAPPSPPKQVLVDGSPLTLAGSAITTTSGSWFYDTTAKVLYVDLGGGNPATGHQIEAGAQTYGFNVSGRTNVLVQGFTTQRQNLAGVHVGGSSAVTVDQVTATGAVTNGILVDTGSSAVTVSGATVSGALSSGIRLNGVTASTVSGSTSHDNGLDGIQLTGSGGDTISGNVTYANVSLSPSATGVGVDVNGASPNAVVTDNVSHDNQDSGFQVYNGSSNAVVARNISYHNGDHGFDTLGATGARYLNNTSYGNNRDGISVEGSSTGATLANNLLIDNGVNSNEFDLFVDASSMSGFSADYDVVYNHAVQGPVKANSTTYPTLAAFQAATGLEPLGASYAPGFVNAGNANFALTGGSAAVDSANAGVTGFIATDQAGNALADDPIVTDTGAGSPTYADRGALEFQPSGSPADYAPHAALFLNPPTVAIPPNGAVLADARGSNDGDTAGIVSYTYDFGDGTVVGPQPGATATHAYAATGTYHVTVTVTDANGLTDSQSTDEVVTNRVVQTYYVAQGAGCSDTGTGSQVTPFCTIGAATKKAVAGDTVLVGPGTYREQLTPTATGQQGAPVTITGSGSSTILLGSTDVSDVAGWTATATTAWKHAYTAAIAPADVWVDGSPLAAASTASTTTSGSFFYDAAAGQLYVDIGGGNPATGHTVEVGARNFGMLLRNVTDYVVSGFAVRETNLAGVYLDTTNRVSLSGITVTQAGTHGVTVDNSTQASLDHITSSNNQSIGVRLFQDTNSTLSASSTHDNQFHGVSVQGGQGNTVSDVTSFRNLKPGTRVADGIDVSQSAVGTVVQRCTTYDNDDSGMEAFTGATGTVFRRNLSYDNGDHGIDNSNGPSSTVVSNTVVGNATAGINFEGGSTGAFVRDNVTMDNAVGSTRTIGEIRVDATSTQGTSLDRDLVFQSAVGGSVFQWAGINYSSLSSATAASGQEAHGINANPGFVNAAARDLRLGGDSPAIDAADTGFTAWAPADLNGNPPIDDPAVTDSGSGPDAVADLGALEYAGPAALGSATPTTGFAPLAVAVDGSASTSLGAPIDSSSWACGNGTTVTGSTGTCTYTAIGSYTPVLTVTAGGVSDTWSTTITVTKDAAPVPALAYAPNPLYVNQTATLNASGSTDNDPTPIATYSFTCGNGTAAKVLTTPTSTCVYTKTGNFTASVTVKDTAGLSATKSITVKVLADAPPVPALTYAPNPLYVNQTATLNASGSTDNDPTPIATYSFTCGNGTAAKVLTTPTSTCVYTKAGNFTASVTVKDTAGLSATKSVTVKVLADAPPKAVLSLSSTRISSGGSIVADASASTDADATPIATYRFNCGNGVTTVNQPSPTTTCTYPTKGQFTVQLWVTDTGGNTASTTMKVQVR